MQLANPTGEEILQAATDGWVRDLVHEWRYPEQDCTWFLEKLQSIPADARVAGGFADALFKDATEQGEGVETLLARLHYIELPSRFKRMPLNLYLLSAAEVARVLGSGETLAANAPTIQASVERGLIAVLINQTMAGLIGRQRVSNALRQISRGLSGVLFSHTTVNIIRRPYGYRAEHRGEHNFLAHFYYARAYYHLLGGEEGPVKKVKFHWVGPDAADVRIVLRDELQDNPASPR